MNLSLKVNFCLDRYFVHSEQRSGLSHLCKLDVFIIFLMSLYIEYLSLVFGMILYLN
jgi:hypothetical protein